jgi:hypothetical protein
VGVSTDAKLVYGYVWEDEHDLFASGEDDEDYDEEESADEPEWEEIIARQRGIANPWDSYPQIIDRLPYDDQRRRGDAWTADHRAELDAWHAAKKAIAEEYGVEVDHHGSDEWEVPVVKITGAGHTAARGYPHQLSGAYPGDECGCLRTLLGSYVSGEGQFYGESGYVIRDLLWARVRQARRRAGQHSGKPPSRLLRAVSALDEVLNLAHGWDDEAVRLEANAEGSPDPATRAVWGASAEALRGNATAARAAISRALLGEEEGGDERR